MFPMFEFNRNEQSAFRLSNWTGPSLCNVNEFHSWTRLNGIGTEYTNGGTGEQREESGGQKVYERRVETEGLKDELAK